MKGPDVEFNKDLKAVTCMLKELEKTMIKAIKESLMTMLLK